MKVLVDIRDNKAAFIMELLNNFPFVKAKPITNEKALLMEELKEAVENVKVRGSGSSHYAGEPKYAPRWDK